MNQKMLGRNKTRSKLIFIKKKKMNKISKPSGRLIRKKTQNASSVSGVKGTQPQLLQALRK